MSTRSTHGSRRTIESVPHVDSERSAEGTTLATLAALYEDGYRRYLRVAEAIVGDVEIAHDAVQEALARAQRQTTGLPRRRSGSRKI